MGMHSYGRPPSHHWIGRRKENLETFASFGVFILAIAVAVMKLFV
jgi:hypothetical protein